MVGVFGELQVVRAIAGIHKPVITRGRVQNCQLPPGAFGGEELSRRMSRALPTKVRVVGAANPGGVPDAAGVIQHGVVGVGLAVPDDLFAPVGGRRVHRVLAGTRRIGVAYGGFEGRCPIGERIQHREVIGTELRRPVNLAVAVDRGISPIRTREIVQIGFRIGPVAHGSDHVALDPLGPWWCYRGQLAGGDAIGPVGQILDG